MKKNPLLLFAPAGDRFATVLVTRHTAGVTLREPRVQARRIT